MASAGVQVDAAGMVTHGDLQDWLVEHLAGLAPVVDRVVLKATATYLLP